MGKKWMFFGPEQTGTSKFERAARRSLATFIFSTGGLVVGTNVFDMDVASWELIASAGIGSLINLAYRWAEGVLKEPTPTDAPGGDVKPG